MSKNLIIVAAAVAGLAIVVFVMNQPAPEPTPQERLQQAAEDAADALSDAKDALTDGAKDATAAISADIQNSMADFAEAIAAQTVTLSEEAQDLVDAWNEAGIITEDGVDYAKARELVEGSKIAQGTKDQLEAILAEIEKAPDELGKYLREIQALLSES